MKLLWSLLFLFAGTAIVPPAECSAKDSEKSTARESAERDMIQLNLPENIEVRLLIEYVSKRLNMNIHYDPAIGKKQVTIISYTKIPKDSLLDLLQSVLKMAGLALVDSDQPGWKRVVPGSDLQSVTKDVQQDAALLQGAKATTAITQVFQLMHVDSATADKTVQPFLSKPGGNIFIIPDSNLLIATDYAVNLRRIASLIRLIDRPGREVNVRFVNVRHRDAAGLATLVASLLEQKNSVASPAGKKAEKLVTLTAEPVTNQIAVISPEGLEKEALGLIKALDVPTGTEIRTYKFAHADPQRVAKLLPDLIGKEAAKKISQAVDLEARSLIVDAPPAIHQQILSIRKQIDVATDRETRSYQFLYISPQRVERIARELIEDPLSLRSYKASIDADSGLMIVTAPGKVHEQLASLKAKLDVPGAVEQLSHIRSYKLMNTTAADVLATIQAIESSEKGLEDVTGREKSENLVQKALQEDKFVGPNQPPPSAPTPDLPEPPAYKPKLSSVLKKAPEGPSASALTAKTSDAVVTADPNTNSIIVVAPPAVQRIYQQLILLLDKRRPQVMVEVTMVTLDTSDNYSLGIEISRNESFGKDNRDRYLTFNSFGLSEIDLNTGQLTIIPGAGFNGSLISPNTVNVVIRALASDGRTKVLAAPRILVNDNASATLSSVAESPYTSVNASTTVATTSFAGYATAGTTLTITPHISEGDHIQLEYTITLNSFTGDGGGGVPPPRQTNTINSKITVPDGFAVIVGGLTRKDFEQTVTRVPGVGQLPGIEYLFSNRTKTDRQSTLYVFIRPVILRDDRFEDLKYLSERDLELAELPSNFPESGPLIMK